MPYIYFDGLFNYLLMCWKITRTDYWYQE